MTSLTVEIVAFGLAIVAAVRSTWSPCGISMLSTLTPLGERSRGHRYPVTVAWFVAGALAGGAVLGGVMAALAAAASTWSASPRALAVAVIAAALVTVASDLRLGGLSLPTVPRQVDEVWTGRYRRWVYAGGFGAQIGVGVSTYVMTAAVYLMIVVAALTRDPLVALLVGVTFGAVRGLAILAGARLTTPAAIRSFHDRFEGAAGRSRAFAVLAQVAVIPVAAGLAVVAAVPIGLAVGQWWYDGRRHRTGSSVRRLADPERAPSL
jgi:MFS family permease